MDNNRLENLLERRPSPSEALSLVHIENTKELIQIAKKIRDIEYGNIISYSRKIFIPLTRLCRDFCHYCTFAKKPKKNKRNFMIT